MGANSEAMIEGMEEDNDRLEDLDAALDVPELVKIHPYSAFFQAIDLTPEEWNDLDTITQCRIIVRLANERQTLLNKCRPTLPPDDDEFEDEGVESYFEGDDLDPDMPDQVDIAFPSAVNISRNPTVPFLTSEVEPEIEDIPF